MFLHSKQNKTKHPPTHTPTHAEREREREYRIKVNYLRYQMKTCRYIVAPESVHGVFFPLFLEKSNLRITQSWQGQSGIS